MRQDLLPPDVREILEERPKPLEAEIHDPPSTHFRLAAGYLDLDNGWHRDFVVRELTGRDEEALGKVTKVGSMMIEILQRGLVSVGPYKSPEIADGLVAGDWETVLLAIRVVTFGETADFAPTCRSCARSYEVTVHLLDDIAKTELTEPSDLHFTVEGRHGTMYHLMLPLGSTQRKMLQATDLSVAEQNTMLLVDCIERVGDRPSLGKETVLNMPLADRREVLRQVIERRPGPRLQEVTTVCPSCGAENNLPLSIAALFQ